MKNSTLEVVLIDGRVRCVYLNDFRIAGSKPYASERPQYAAFPVAKKDLREALCIAASDSADKEQS